MIKEINKWERDSIKKIQNTAEKARQQLFQKLIGDVTDVERRLTKLTDQLRQSREENDFVETDINEWKERLYRLSEELTKPPNIILHRDFIPLVHEISVDVIDLSKLPNIDTNARWIPNGVTVAGGNGNGSGLNQLYHPYGIYVYDNRIIYVADYSNHRIVEWVFGATTGKVVAGGNGSGSRMDQLNRSTEVIVDKKKDCLIICDQDNRRIVRWPRQNGTTGQIIISDVDCWGVALNNDGCLYVSDRSKHGVRCWREGDTSGTVIAGGNNKGNRLHQLNGPTCIFFDQDSTVYVTDTNNHRVMKWIKGAKEGIVVAAGQGQGNNQTQLSIPYGLVVDRAGIIFVAEFGNHRVMRWPKGSAQGSVIAGGKWTWSASKSIEFTCWSVNGSTR